MVVAKGKSDDAHGRNERAGNECECVIGRMSDFLIIYEENLQLCQMIECVYVYVCTYTIYMCVLVQVCMYICMYVSAFIAQ